MELLKSDLTELSLIDESPSTCALNLLLAASFMLENIEIINPFDNSTTNYWYQVSSKSGSDPFTKSLNATWCNRLELKIYCNKIWNRLSIDHYNLNFLAWSFSTCIWRIEWCLKYGVTPMITNLSPWRCWST